MYHYHNLKDIYLYYLKLILVFLELKFIEIISSIIYLASIIYFNGMVHTSCAIKIYIDYCKYKLVVIKKVHLQKKYNNAS